MSSRSLPTDEDSEDYDVSPSPLPHDSNISKSCPQTLDQVSKTIETSLATSSLHAPSVNLATDDILCEICHELVVDAVQITCCGALGCGSCAKALIAGVETCPFCKVSAKTMQTVPDKRAERKSMLFPRCCSYRNEGCQFVGNRAEVCEHIRYCECIPKQRVIEMLKVAEYNVVQLTAKLEKLTSSTSFNGGGGSSGTSCEKREFTEALRFDRTTDFWYPLQGTHLWFSFENHNEWTCKLSPNQGHTLIITLSTESQSVHVSIKFANGSLALTSGIAFSFLHPTTFLPVVCCKFMGSVLAKLKVGEEVGYKSVLTAEEFASLVIHNQFHVLFDRC